MSGEDFEPVPGLPERLPQGEQMLWQGAPDWRSLATRAFHWRAVAAYFGLLGAWRLVSGLVNGEAPSTVLGALAFLLPIALVALAIIVGFAVLAARATLYTVTDRRIVMRIGIALSVTLNIPFRAIDGAGLKLRRDGTGDISLVLAPDHRIAFLSLWPHVRPWRLARPEPTLRCIRNPERIAQILSTALAASADQAAPKLRRAVSQSPDPSPAGAAHAALAS